MDGDAEMIQINIKMPNCCYDCPFSDDSGDYPYCWVLHQNRGYKFDRKTKRFPNCPLIEADSSEHDGEMARQKDMCRVLFNRCRAVMSCDGALCVFCGMRKECEETNSLNDRR